MLLDSPTLSLNLSPQDAAQELLQRRRARRGLVDFACYVDPNADGEYQRRVGANPYRAQHLQKIAAIFEQLERRELRRAIIVVPRRHWKSSLLEKFAAWYLGKHPEHALILGSYAEGLAQSFSHNIRDLIGTNSQYRAVFPGVALKEDTREVTRWALTGAYRYSLRAAGRGSGIVGGGCDGLLLDDLLKDWEEAQSQTVKDGAWDWLTKTAFSGLEPNAFAVMVTTRWAEDDMVGRIEQAEKEQGGEHWEIINLPMEAPDGTPLWEERYSRDEIVRIKSRSGMTDRVYRLIYQGEAVQREGNEIKQAWFEYYRSLPDGAKWSVHAYDLALTEKEVDKSDPDYTADVLACGWKDELWLGLPRLRRQTFADIQRELEADIRAERGNGIRHGTGKSLHEKAMVSTLAAKGLYLEQYDESGDKGARARSTWIPMAETRRVKLVGTKADWEPFVAQWLAFPSGAHDDALDVVSGAAQMLGFRFNPTPQKLPQRKRVDYRKMYG